MATIDDPKVQAALRTLADSSITAPELVRALGRTMPENVRLSYAGKVVPTVAEMLGRVRADITNPGTLATWAPHFARLESHFGSHLVDMVDLDDLEHLGELARKEALARGRDLAAKGRGAVQSHVDAMRYFFGRVHKSRYREDNPAAHLSRPRPRTRVRRPLDASEVALLWKITADGGDDPALDTLLVRFALETGARRNGISELRLGDVDFGNQLVRLSEKFDKSRIVPITRVTAESIRALAAERGSHSAEDPAFRYKPRAGVADGRPLTRRRFNTWAERVQREAGSALPPVSTHWLRHTAGRSLERVGGVAVAAEFLGHEHPGSVTFTYVRACAQEVINAWSLAVGEQHPLATVDVAAVAGDSEPQAEQEA